MLFKQLQFVFKDEQNKYKGLWSMGKLFTIEIVDTQTNSNTELTIAQNAVTTVVYILKPNWILIY